MKLCFAAVALMAYSASALQMCIHTDDKCEVFSENCFTPVLDTCSMASDGVANGKFYYKAKKDDDKVHVDISYSSDEQCLKPSRSFDIKMNNCQSISDLPYKAVAYVMITDKPQPSQPQPSQTAKAEPKKKNTGVFVAPSIVASGVAMLVAMVF